MTTKQLFTHLTRALFLGMIVFLFSSAQPKQESTPQYVLLIHGGAGFLDTARSCEQNLPYTNKLKEALRAGEDILKNGGSSLDAVETAVRILEDSPLFNAGKGSVFSYEGRNEMDASIMDGSSLKAGAVTGVRHAKNPVTLARAVMDTSVHVMLSGSGAEEFARQHSIELADSSYFFTQRRWDALQKAKRQTSKKEKHGTVGAVALDTHGNLAAATSTGGMTNKRYGRIGDSPVIGAGTYANNSTCAVSCTGHGEYFIRNAVAYDLHARMQYNKQSVQEAAHDIIHETLKKQNGTGGLIVVDKDGHFAMPFNTTMMFRGYVKSDGKIDVKIF